MSLDIIDLRVLTESGTEKEKWYAHRILPVRKHGNWLLCTLLIGNTAVNSALAIVTADLFGGIAGFLSSSITILYVGEIIPQAVCHRFGLVIGAHAIPIVRIFMYLTAPLSFTTAKALDFFLGGEPVTRYNKSQLKSLLSIHGNRSSAATPAQSRDAVEHPPLIASNLYSPDDAIVNIHQNPIHSIPPANSHSQSLSQDTKRVLPSKSASLQNSSNPTCTASVDKTSDTTDDNSKGNSNPMCRLLGLTRSKFRDRVSEKRDREHDSVSSNPPLTKDEIVMLGGAFDFSQKAVFQVMTSLDDVFMLEASLSLNFEVLLLVFQSGHSRIPVYNKSRDNIIGLLFAKDLILLDPEDSVPIQTVLLFFNRTVLLVMFDTTLNKMLNIFRQGRGHMALVQKKLTEQSTPDVLGVVTLEDLIEELIGQDIVDETDVYTDNVNKQRVKRIRSIDPEMLKMFDSKHDEELLSEKEVLVVASYLCNNTEEFSEKLIDMNILRQILAEIPIVEYHDGDRQRSVDAFHNLPGLSRLNSSPKDEPVTKTYASINNSDEVHSSGVGENSVQVTLGGSQDITIYSRGVPTKNAFLIINGRLEISAGTDGFKSEAGPWTILGTKALTDDLFAPDFTARVVERPARLLRIPRRIYRNMIQYSSGASRPGSGDIRNGLKEKSAPMRDASPSEQCSEKGGVLYRSSSSLALAAAAAAVAVGNPKRIGEGPVLPGTASEAPVVRKSCADRNGESYEWSEMEPGLIHSNDEKPELGPLEQIGEGMSAERRKRVGITSASKPPTRPRTASKSGSVQSQIQREQ